VQQLLTGAKAQTLQLDENNPRTGFYTVVYKDGQAGIEAYAAFCRSALYSGSQNPLWVKSWLGPRTDDERLIAIAWKDGQPALALGLAVERRGPLRIATFPGGPHATSTFVASGDVPLDAADLYAVLNDIHAARPDIDAIILKRQRLQLEGRANPLRELWHIISPNLTFAMSLAPCRETGIIRSKHRMSHHRQVRRKFETFGEIRVFQAQTREEVDRLFDHFFEWKAEQLAFRGIPDSFAPEEVRASLRNTFRLALEQEEPSFEINGLEIAGKLRAINAYSRTSEGPLCEFLAYCNDELAQWGPGEFLTYKMIEKAIESGASVYDFGIGDEPYKRQWTDRTREEFDSYFGLTFRGKMYVLAVMCVEYLKRFIKRSPLLSGFVKRARKGVAALAQFRKR